MNVRKKNSLIVGIFLSLNAFVYAQLPNTFPNSPELLEVYNLIIAEHFAPTIHQMAEDNNANALGGLSDLITSVYFDGDLSSKNNWENLADYTENNPSTHNELDPYVYYSVVWFENYWILTYAFYHPRDYSSQGLCCPDNHENDLEGAIFVIDRNSQEVIKGGTISHNDLKSFNEPGVPDIYIDNGTHSVEANIGEDGITHINPCDNELHFSQPHIIYTYNSAVDPHVTLFDGPFEAELFISDPTSTFMIPTFQTVDVLSGEGNYGLIDIFGLQDESLWNQRENFDLFLGDKFVGAAPDQSNTDCQDEGDASAPWGWSQFNYSLDHLVDLIGEEDDLIWNPYSNYCGYGGLDLVIAQDTEWNTSNFESYEFIRIRNGATLTLSNMTLSMGRDARIHVEEGALIVNNSIINSCSSVPYYSNATTHDWYGISVFPGQRLELINNSRIEEAQNGILISFFQGDINNVSELKVSNSTIAKCGIGIKIDDSKISTEFNYPTFINNDIGIKISESNDEIVIMKPVFKENNQGVYIYENDGHVKLEDGTFTHNNTAIDLYESKEVSVINCDITGMEKLGYDHYSIGLNSINSNSIVIDGNLIKDCYRAIEVDGTYPLSSGMVLGSINTEHNTFQKNYFSVTSSGNEHPVGVLINNNLIDHTSGSSFYGLFGVNLKGANKSRFSNNTIKKAQSAFIANSTGDNENFYSCNDIQEAGVQDMAIQGENKESSILQNIFDSPYVFYGNLNLYDSQIKSDQGLGSNAAANCFSPLAPARISADEGTQSFTYHFFNDSQNQDCQVPEQSNIYSISQSASPGDHCPSDIGHNFSNGGGEDDFINVFSLEPPVILSDPYCKPCIVEMINESITIAVQNGGDNPLTNVNEGGANLLLEETLLFNWIEYAIFIGIHTNDYLFIEQVLIQLRPFRWQKRLLGVYFLTDQLQKASSLISSLPISNQDQVYFKSVQEINLDLHILGRELYILNDSDKLLLQEIANSITPSSGYARSLYHLLTGDILEIDIPMPEQVSRPRTAQNAISDSKISVYPNPSSGSFVIDSEDSITKVEIIDMHGSLLFKLKNYNIGQEIKLENAPKGVYLIKCTMSNGTIKSTKFSTFN